MLHDWIVFVYICAAKLSMASLWLELGSVLLSTIGYQWQMSERYCTYCFCYTRDWLGLMGEHCKFHSVCTNSLYSYLVVLIRDSCLVLAIVKWCCLKHQSLKSKAAPSSSSSLLTQIFHTRLREHWVIAIKENLERSPSSFVRCIVCIWLVTGWLLTGFLYIFLNSFLLWYNSAN